jgi:hypothetical protein
MSKFGTSKERLESISFDDETNLLTIRWDTRGNVGAVCGMVLKVELVEKIISSYRPPHIEWNQDYNEAF